jgi:hypothetical protein
MNAAIEGDCDTLWRVLSGAGIQSIVDEPLLVNILPLHRAVSGFHFHGNHKILINTLSTLLEFGADINAVDLGGNSVLHKAIQVCTSASVLPVVRFILERGANANGNPDAQNQDSPIATEILRLRRKSPEVIELLCNFGANVNFKREDSGMTALTLVLQCAQNREVKTSNDFKQDNNIETISNSSLDGTPSSSSSSSTTTTTTASHSGRNFWVPVAYLLLEKGCRWSPSYRDEYHGRSQLHLLFSGPCPPSKDMNKFIAIFKHALSYHKSHKEHQLQLHNNNCDDFMKVKDNEGFTFLELAQSRHENSFEELDILIQLIGQLNNEF